MEKLLTLIAFITLPLLSFSQDMQQANAGFKYFETLTAIDDRQFSDECVFVDEIENVCYVDFQKIKLNLKEVVVIDETGNIVFTKNVANLPVDTILEIDLGEKAKGKYVIELRSYIKSLHRLVNFS